MSAADPTKEESRLVSPLPEKYDFKKPMILSRSELRTLKAGHEEFAQSLSSLLSTYLRTEFSLSLSNLETVSFQSVLQAVSAPAHLIIFRIEPLRGACLLQIDPAFAMGMVDRLMGGPGIAGEAERELTEIEVALLDQAMDLMLGEWCSHWEDQPDLRASIVSHENNPRFVQICPPKTLMLVLEFGVLMGEASGKIRLIAPYKMIEPLIRKGIDNTESPAEVVAPSKTPAAWNPQLENISLHLTAGWGVKNLPARTLASLQVGEFLELNAGLPEEVELRVGNLTKFKGRLGQQGSNWAVEIKSLKI